MADCGIGNKLLPFIGTGRSQAELKTQFHIVEPSLWVLKCLQKVQPLSLQSAASNTTKVGAGQRKTCPLSCFQRAAQQSSRMNEILSCWSAVVPLLGQVLDVQQHGILLRPHLITYQQVGHQFGAQSCKRGEKHLLLPR